MGVCMTAPISRCYLFLRAILRVCLCKTTEREHAGFCLCDWSIGVEVFAGMGMAGIPERRLLSTAAALELWRSHMRVLPPGTLCPTTSALSLILSSSENC